MAEQGIEPGFLETQATILTIQPYAMNLLGKNVHQEAGENIDLGYQLTSFSSNGASSVYLVPFSLFCFLSCFVESF